MRYRHALFALLSSIGLLVGACVFVNPIPTGPITVVLVNQTRLDVEPNLFISATATQAADLFQDGNLVEDFTDRAFPELRPEETITLSYPCKELASIGVDGPAMIDALAIERTESNDSAFYVTGDALPCESTIRFTYYVEDGEFHVRTTVE